MGADDVSKHILEAEQRLWMKGDGRCLTYAHAFLDLCNFESSFLSSSL